MAHGIETLFYAGETPWHKLGVAVEEAKTSEEAIKLAGLDWEVKLGPLYGGPDRKHLKRVEGRFAIYRTNDGRVLGEVSSRYEPYFNRNAFEWLDSLVKDRVMVYETAGSLLGGKVVWMLARLSKDMTIAGSTYVPYILLTTRHDGWGPVRAQSTLERVVCWNTLQWALVAGSQHAFRVVHNPALHRKMEDARKVLEVTTEDNARLQEWLEVAATMKVTGKQVDQIQEELFGTLDDQTPAQRRSSIETFREIYHAESAEGQTAGALVATVTGFADHAFRYNGDSEKREESRFMSITDSFGTAAKFKARGIEAIKSLDKALVV